MLPLARGGSASGRGWAALTGQSLLGGVWGNGAQYPPLLVYVSRWFDRRRGTALALISSGQYIAGMLWPAAFEFGIANFGWRSTMLVFATLVIIAVPPIAALFLAPPPAHPEPPFSGPSTRLRRQ